MQKKYYKNLRDFLFSQSERGKKIITMILQLK